MKVVRTDEEERKKKAQEDEIARKDAQARIATMLGMKHKHALANQGFTVTWKLLAEMAQKQMSTWKKGGKLESVGVYDSHRLEGLVWFLKKARQLGLPYSKKEVADWTPADDLVAQLRKDVRGELQKGFHFTTGEVSFVTAALVFVIENHLETVLRMAKDSMVKGELPDVEQLRTMTWEISHLDWTSADSLDELEEFRTKEMGVREWHWLLDEYEETKASSSTEPGECSDGDDGHLDEEES